MGHGGLALANSVAVTLEVLALLVLLQRRLGQVIDRDFGSLMARLLIASAAMGGAILLLTTYAGRAGWGNLMTLAIAGAVGVSHISLRARRSRCASYSASCAWSPAAARMTTAFQEISKPLRPAQEYGRIGASWVEKRGHKNGRIA